MATRLLALDTASLYFRAFHGVPDSLRSPSGEPVNAVRGLLDFISRFVRDYSPTHLACAWDNDWRPRWRVDLLPSYKTHRVAAGSAPEVVGAGGRGAESGLAEEAPDGIAEQVEVIAEVLGALGLTVIGADGYEADDVLGSLCNPDRPWSCDAVDVVTGDRDLFQLVDDATARRVLYVARGVSRHERVDAAWVRGKYGIGPEQYADFAVLRGDPSDGIPGVAGIGEKTAASLLTSHGDLAGILAAASRPGSTVAAGIRSKLGAAIDYLAVAPEVVQVARDLDLGPVDLTLPAAPADPGRFAELTERWGLGSSAERILAAMAREN